MGKTQWSVHTRDGENKHFSSRGRAMRYANRYGGTVYDWEGGSAIGDIVVYGGIAVLIYWAVRMWVL